MCLGVYLGTDSPQPLVAWDEKNPAFNVTELSDYEKSVSQQFTKTNLYYLGAYTGCSCGFSPDSGDGPEASRESIGQLYSYVAKASQKSEIEIFVCWEGDWEAAPTKVSHLNLEDLRDSEKWLNEQQKTVIKVQHNKAL